MTVAEDRGRERHYRLNRAGLQPVHEYLGQLTPAPPFADSDLDGLEFEVRRVGRDRRTAEQNADATNAPINEETG